MKTVMIGAALALMAASPAMAGELGSGVGLNANGSISTESTYRGLSQSNGKTSATAEVEVTYQGGYVGVQGTTLGSQSIADSRVDYAAGYRTSVVGIDVDAGVRYNSFRGRKIAGPGKMDYIEYQIHATKDVGPAAVTAGVTYSPDYLSAVGIKDAVYTEASVVAPVAEVAGVKISALAGVGHQFLSGSPVVNGYTDWNIGASASYKNIFATVKYVDSNAKRHNAFLAIPGVRAGGSHVVGQVGVRF